MRRVVFSLVLIAPLVLIGQKNDLIRVQELNEKSKSYLRIDRDSACLLANESYELNKSRFPKEEALNWLVLGICQKNEGNKDSAYQMFEKARIFFTSNTYKADEGIANWYKAKIWHELNQYEKARECFENAIELLEESQDHASLFKVVNGLAIVELKQGNLSKGLQHLGKALEINLREGFGDAYKIYNNMSVVYAKLNDFDKALEFNVKARNVSDTLSNKGLIVSALVQRAKLFEKVGVEDSALFYFEQAIFLSRKFDGDEGFILEKVAKYHHKIGEHENAIRAYNALTKTDLGQANMLTIFLKLSEIYADLDKLDSVILFSSKAHKLAVEQGRKIKTYQSAKILSDSYYKRGEFNKAFKYLKTYSLYKDSVFLDKEEKKLIESQVQIATLDKENELQRLRASAEIERLNNLSMLRMSISATIILLLVLALIILLNRYRQKIQRLKASEMRGELERNKRELHTQAMHMIRVNNNIKDIEEKLKELKPKINGYSMDLQRIINGIKINKSQEKDWDNFNQYFNGIHDGFLESLKSRFPTLTVGEIRLCSLLRMNLTNSEIAGITNVADRSVIMAKYRMRKKMGLDEKEDLHNYLMNLN